MSSSSRALRARNRWGAAVSPPRAPSDAAQAPSDVAPLPAPDPRVTSSSTAPSDPSLVVVPPSGASTSTTTTPWSTVVAGSPHSAWAGPPAPHAPSHPHESFHGGFALLANPTNESVPTPLATEDSTTVLAEGFTAVPPRPLDYDDIEFLLGELTTLGNKSAEDWAIQNDRHTAYLVQMLTLDKTITTQTTLASGIMSAVTTLRDQFDSIQKDAVAAYDLAHAVQEENIALQATLQDLQASLPSPTPLHT